jgi:hypothetical protein
MVFDEKMLNKERICRFRWLAVLMSLLFPYFAVSQVQVGTLRYTIQEPIPWGQIAFTKRGYLLVPVAQTVKLSEEEIRAEQERRRKWLEKPTEEQVDELVKREPGEDERAYRLRRWIAEKFLEGLKANPDAAIPREPQRVRRIELRVLHPTSLRLEEIARIPLWEGDVDDSTQVSYFEGHTLTKSMTNIWAGALVGEHWIAAWARVHYPRGKQPRQDIALILDANDPKRFSLLGEMHPLCWTGINRLLVMLNKNGRPTLAELELDADGKVQQERVLALAPEQRLSAVPVPNTKRILLKSGFVAYWLDLETGKVSKQQTSIRVGREEIKVPSWTNPLVHGDALWMADWLKSRLYKIASSGGNDLQVVASWSLPYKMGEDFWDGAVVAVGETLILARARQLRRSLGPRASSSTTTGWFSLWLFEPKSGSLQLLNLPDIRIDAETRPAAVSPDGHWLALRVDENRLQIWMLGK